MEASVALNTPKLDTAVSDFKKVCGTHDKLYRYGQFYVTRRTMDDLFKSIEVDLKANPRLKGSPGQPDNFIRFFFNNLSKSVEKVNVPLILAQLDLVERNGDMAWIRTLFMP